MQEFIRKNGVTPCPSFGTPEFREMNIAREKARFDEKSQKSRGWRVAKKSRLQKAVRA